MSRCHERVDKWVVCHLDTMSSPFQAWSIIWSGMMLCSNKAFAMSEIRMIVMSKRYRTWSLLTPMVILQSILNAKVLISSCREGIMTLPTLLIFSVMILTESTNSDVFSWILFSWASNFRAEFRMRVISYVLAPTSPTTGIAAAAATISPYARFWWRLRVVEFSRDSLSSIPAIKADL